MAFSRPIYGAGMNIGPDWYGAYTATLVAYNGTTVIGMVSINGNANSGASYQYIGFNTLNGVVVTSIDISVSGQNNFAIGDISLNVDDIVPTVPEPGAMSLLLTGFAALASRLRLSRQLKS